MDAIAAGLPYTYPPDCRFDPDHDVPGDSNTQARARIDTETAVELEYEDSDWYRVRLTVGETYTISIASSDPQSGIQPMLGIMTHDGEPILAHQDARSTDFTAETTGTYFIAIYHTPGTGSENAGPAVLTVSTASRLHEVEWPGVDFSADTTTTGLISYGQVSTGQIGYVGDVDWFAVALASGVYHNVHIGPGDNNNGADLAEQSLSIYDAQGTPIEGPINASGIHYVAVSANDDWTGDYTVYVVEDSGSADSVTPVEFPADGLVSGIFESSGDHDLYAMTVQANTYNLLDIQAETVGGAPANVTYTVSAEDGSTVFDSTSEVSGRPRFYLGATLCPYPGRAEVTNW